MSPAAPVPAAAPPAADRAAASRAMIERQMARLERLADIGMEIAEAAGRRARALAEDGGADVQAADPALAYSRAARAVRLTLALQSNLAEGLKALDRARDLERIGRAGHRRHRIHRLIEQAARAEGCDAYEARGLASDAWERLTDTDDDDILDRPFEEVVALICRELGLPGDWGVDGAAEEAPSVGIADSSPALQGSSTLASPPLQGGGGGGRRPTEGANSTTEDADDPAAPRAPGRSARRSSGATPPPSTGAGSPPSAFPRSAGTAVPGWGSPGPAAR